MAKGNKRKTKGVYDTNSPKIDFSEWSLDAVNNAAETIVEPLAEQLEELVNAAIVEGLHFAKLNYDAYVFFPEDFNCGDEPSDGCDGPPPIEPTTLYIELPIGPSDDEYPRWSFSLSNIVDTHIAYNLDGGGVGEDYSPSIRIAKGLRELAERIEKAIPK